MPIFKITTTTISFIDINTGDEVDLEAFEDAIGEDGEIDPSALADLLENDMDNPHSSIDCDQDSQTTTVTRLSESEEKAYRENQ